MKYSCEIAKFLDQEHSNCMNELIAYPFGYFLRRLDQVNMPIDRKIAQDDGTSINEINLQDLSQILKGIKCSGTYSYTIKTKDGGNTRIAISKED